MSRHFFLSLGLIYAGIFVSSLLLQQKQSALAASPLLASTFAAETETPPQSEPLPTAAEARLIARLHAFDQNFAALAAISRQRASSGDVRAYALRLGRDFRWMDRELLSLAGSAGFATKKISPPTDDPTLKAQLASASELRQKKGAAFDDGLLEFTEQQVENEIDLIDADQGKFANDTELQEYLRGLVPVLRQYLQLSYEIRNPG